MPRMKFVSSLLLNQIGHALGGPQTGAIPQRFGAFFQSTGKPIQVHGPQARLAASSARLPERLGSLLAPGLVPAADRLTVNAQSSRYLALTQATVKEFSRPESPSLQLFKIPFHAFRIAHVQRLT